MLKQDVVIRERECEWEKNGWNVKTSHLPINMFNILYNWCIEAIHLSFWKFTLNEFSELRPTNTPIQKKPNHSKYLIVYHSTHKTNVCVCVFFCASNFTNILQNREHIMTILIDFILLVHNNFNNYLSICNRFFICIAFCLMTMTINVKQQHQRPRKKCLPSRFNPFWRLAFFMWIFKCFGRICVLFMLKHLRKKITLFSKTLTIYPSNDKRTIETAWSFFSPFHQFHTQKKNVLFFFLFVCVDVCCAQHRSFTHTHTWIQQP